MTTRAGYGEGEWERGSGVNAGRKAGREGEREEQ